MTKPDQWRFLIETFPNEMEEIVSSEIMTGLNHRGDDKLTRDIRAAEDVIDPAHTPPLAWFMADLGLERKPATKPATDAELLALKLAYADAYITLDSTPLGRDGDDSLWDAAYAGWKQAEDNLKAASRARKAGAK